MNEEEIRELTKSVKNINKKWEEGFITGKTYYSFRILELIDERIKRIGIDFNKAIVVIELEELKAQIEKELGVGEK